MCHFYVHFSVDGRQRFRQRIRAWMKSREKIKCMAVHINSRLFVMSTSALIIHLHGI